MEAIFFGAVVEGEGVSFEVLDAIRKGGIVLQLLDASKVVGKGHLKSALSHAERAHERGHGISSSLDMEILLYAAGERHIDTAISKMGVKGGGSPVAGIAVGVGDEGLEPLLSRLGLCRDDSVLEPSRKKLLSFGIGDEEIDAVGEENALELVLERVALLDVTQ